MHIYGYHERHNCDVYFIKWDRLSRGGRIWSVSLRWFLSRGWHGVGRRTLVHAWIQAALSTIFNPYRFPLFLSACRRFSRVPPDATPLYPFLFYLFLPALSTHPSSFYSRTAPVHVHTPSLTLSATTSVLHSKALTSETSASTPEDGFIGYSSPCIRRQGARGNGPDGEFQPRREWGVDRNYYQGWRELRRVQAPALAVALWKFVPWMRHASFDRARDEERRTY